MHLKAAIILLFIGTLAVNNSQAWGWVKKIWNGAKRIWRRHSWVRNAAGAAAKVAGKALLSWGDIKKLRDMDDDTYEEFMMNMEKDISDDFDNDQARDFATGMDEIRHLNDAEFQKLEQLAVDYANQKKTEDFDT